MESVQATSGIQILGGMGFGILIGWYVYYINRHRKAEIQLSDLVTLIGVLGGGAILAIFPAGSDLFGAYGVGLFLGFFGYFLVLIVLTAMSKNFDVDYFLDGRRKKPTRPYYIPGGTESLLGAMGDQEEQGGGPRPPTIK